MAPNSNIILIRHGQAAHNVKDDFDLHDPLLTERGEDECSHLLKDVFLNEYPLANEVDCLVVSPLQRTLQTALGGFGNTYIKDPAVKTIILAALQETTARPCDTGTELDELQKLYPQYDLSDVDPNFTKKTEGFYHPDNLPQRAAFVRKWLYDCNYQNIVVVTHSGFLKRLTPQYFQITAGLNKDIYRNCEYREFTFTATPQDTSLGGPYQLEETEWSHENRHMKHAIAVLTTDLMAMDIASRDRAIEAMDIKTVGIGAKSEVPGDDGHDHDHVLVTKEGTVAAAATAKVADEHAKDVAVVEVSDEK